MFEKLEAYLNVTTSDGLRDTLLGCCNLLWQSGVDEHLYLLDVQLDVAESLEFDVVYQGIYGVLWPLMNRTLADLGVRVLPDTELRYMRDILQALQLVENWGDKNSINALCEANEDNLDTLADVLTLIGEFKPEDYLQVLDSVSDDLITRMGEISREDFEGAVIPTPEVVAAVKSRLHGLVSRNSIANTVFLHALNSGMRLGAPFSALLSPWRESLNKVPAEQLGTELVLFAAASSLPVDRLKDAIDKERSNYDASIVDMMSIDQGVIQLLKGIPNAQA